MTRFLSYMFFAMVLHQSSQMIVAVIKANNEVNAAYQTAQDNCQSEQTEFCENPDMEELHALLDGDRLVQQHDREHQDDPSFAEQVNLRWIRGAMFRSFVAFPSRCLATAWSEQRVKPACNNALWHLQSTLDTQRDRHWVRTIVFMIWVFGIWKLWSFVRFVERSILEREAGDATQADATEKLADDQENDAARLIVPHKAPAVNKAADHKSAAKSAEEMELAAARIAAAQKIAAERVATAQSKYSERTAAAQSKYSERMAAAQNIYSERMAAAQQMYSEKMAAAQKIFSERTAAAQKIFSDGGSGQDFVSAKRTAGQDFVSAKRAAGQDFVSAKRGAGQEFVSAKRNAGQEFVAEKTAASQEFVAERTSASQDFLKERRAAGHGHVSNAVLAVLSALVFIACLVGAYFPLSLIVS